MWEEKPRRLEGNLTPLPKSAHVKEREGPPAEWRLLLLKDTLLTLRKPWRRVWQPSKAAG